MLLLILCLVPGVLSEVSQHHVYVSRKSRDNSKPYSSGYVYKQVNNNPGTFSTFGTEMENGNVGSRSTDSDSLPIDLKIHLTPDISSLSKDSAVKYDASFLASKIKGDSMYDRMKSAMSYQPVAGRMFGYETEHLKDAEADSKGHGIPSSPVWPYLSYNPYESEHMRIDAEIERAKDKRYTMDAAKIIPIHEDLSDDIPNSREPLVSTEYYFPSTDNPIRQFPLHYSALGDYFKMNNFKDELTFKDLGQGKYFDSETSRDNFSKFRRFPR